MPSDRSGGGCLLLNNTRLFSWRLIKFARLRLPALLQRVHDAHGFGWPGLGRWRYLDLLAFRPLLDKLAQLDGIAVVVPLRLEQFCLPVTLHRLFNAASQPPGLCFSP